MRLEDKVALITGAAHGVKGELMGFGGAAAWLFAEEGAKVALTDIDVDAGERTVAQMRDEGHDVMFIEHDVTVESAWERAIQATLDAYGTLNVLVNNAGTAGSGKVEDTTESSWDRQMDLHAKGVFLGTKYAIPPMREAGGGSIINISSIYGIIASQGSTDYHAAKGASRIFTKSAAVQLARDGIRVNSVHPGFCLTPMNAIWEYDEERRRRFQKQIPMSRLGNAMEIAYGILFLASDESSYMTGSELVIDGGVTTQ